MDDLQIYTDLLYSLGKTLPVKSDLKDALSRKLGAEVSKVYNEVLNEECWPPDLSYVVEEINIVNEVYGVGR